MVVLNWNTRERTIGCVRGLLASQPSQTQIVLVDNGSTDGSAQAFRAAFPDLTVLALDQNYGFSRGVNHGIRHALAAYAPDYVLLLNNDTTVTGVLLTQLADRMDLPRTLASRHPRSFTPTRQRICGASAARSTRIGSPSPAWVPAIAVSWMPFNPTLCLAAR